MDNSMEVNKNEKIVQRTIPGTVTAGPTLRPVFPPLPRARESAARLPASRDTLHYNTRSYPEPSGGVSVGDSGFGVGRPSTCGQLHTRRYPVLIFLPLLRLQAVATPPGC